MRQIGNSVKNKEGKVGVIMDIRKDVLKPTKCSTDHLPRGVCIDTRYLMAPMQMIGGKTDHQYLVKFRINGEEEFSWVDGFDLT